MRTAQMMVLNESCGSCEGTGCSSRTEVTSLETEAGGNQKYSSNNGCDRVCIVFQQQEPCHLRPQECWEGCGVQVM